MVKRVSELSETHTQYETKDEIETMREKSQNILDERALIETKLQAMRDNLSAELYDSVVTTANELLKLNITDEEKAEVEKAKTTAEAKIEEQKAAEAKAEQEARQNQIDNAIKISASELYNAFSTNEVGADNKYKNKMLIVTGDIYQIDKVIIFGNPVIYLQAGYTADAIHAFFSKSDSDGLTDLKKGQTVRILGQCTGLSFGSVTLNDCSIVE